MTVSAVFFPSPKMPTTFFLCSPFRICSSVNFSRQTFASFDHLFAGVESAREMNGGHEDDGVGGKRPRVGSNNSYGSPAPADLYAGVWSNSAGKWNGGNVKEEKAGGELQQMSELLSAAAGDSAPNAGSDSPHSFQYPSPSQAAAAAAAAVSSAMEVPFSSSTTSGTTVAADVIYDSINHAYSPSLSSTLGKSE